MNYFYDVMVNLHEVNYKFYEWSMDDEFIHLKRVPIYKLKSQDIQKFLLHNIQVKREFLEGIKDKTTSIENEKLLYIALFTDGNNTIVLEFNEDGKSILRSSLLIAEELDLMEIAYSLEEEKLEYEVLEKIKDKNEVRQVERIKKFLNKEIDYSFNQQDFDKLKYLYQEISEEQLRSDKKIYEFLKILINGNYNDNILKLFNIIKLYKKNLMY